MSTKKELLNGVLWTALSRYSGFFIQIVITAVLARLLTPEDFGVIAIALVFITFFNLLSDFGIGPAIIQVKDLDNNEINSIFSITIWGGVFLAIFFFYLSFPISSVYNSDDLKVVLQILTINIAFVTWNIVPNAIILKEKKFKLVSIRTMFLQIVSGILSIAAAYHGFGIYALVLSPIITAIGIFIINYYHTDLKFIISFNKTSIRKIYKFSIYQLLFNLSNYFFRNLDKILIGKYLSMKDLGYYDKSYHLMLMPMNYTSSVFNQVLHPILSDLQKDYHEMASKYNKIVQILAFISFPIGTFLFFASEDVIMVLYGSQWRPAISVFHILSLSIPLQLILTTIGSIYQAAGDTKRLFYTGLASSVITILGFLVALIVYESIDAVAWSWNITLLFSFVINYYTLYRKTLHENLWPFIESFKIPLLLSFFCSMILFSYPLLIPSNLYLFNLLLKAIIVLVVTIIVLYYFHIVDFQKIWLKYNSFLK